MQVRKDDDDDRYLRRNSSRSRSRAASSSVNRRERYDGDVDSSRSEIHQLRSDGSVRSSSRQESPSYTFHTDDDSSDYGTPGSSRVRSSSTSGIGSSIYRRSSSVDEARQANYDSWERSGRPRQRAGEEISGSLRAEGFSAEHRGSSADEPDYQWSRVRKYERDFLSPPELERRRPRPRSADAGDPGISFLRPHRSTESFEELNLRPREILELGELVHSNSQAFDELARTTRDKGDLITRPDTDLTFDQITKSADDAQYRIRAWTLAVQLSEATRIASDDDGTLEVVQTNLATLRNLARDLSILCAKARPDDLVEREDDFDAYIEYLIERSPTSPQPPLKREQHRNPLGFRIREKLTAVESRLQNIEVLAAPLKETLESNLQPSLRRKVVQDAERFFGSEEKLRRYPITPGLTGEAALREAQATYVMTDKVAPQHKPVVYLKARGTYLDTETLDFYNLRWERDKEDPEYIIILEDSTNLRPEVLFEHTRRLRERRQFEAGAERRYIQVERKSRSPSREAALRFKLSKD